MMIVLTPRLLGSSRAGAVHSHIRLRRHSVSIEQRLSAPLGNHAPYRDGIPQRVRTLYMCLMRGISMRGTIDNIFCSE